MARVNGYCSTCSKRTTISTVSYKCDNCMSYGFWYEIAKNRPARIAEVSANMA